MRRIYENIYMKGREKQTKSRNEFYEICSYSGRKGKMRIRKNTTLSSILLGTAGYSGERQEAYVCLFNQSPWDITSSRHRHGHVTSSCFLPAPSLIHRFDKEDSFTANMNLGDSNVAAGRENLIVMEDYKKSKVVEPGLPVKTSRIDDQVAISLPAPPKRGRPRSTTKKAPGSTAESNNQCDFYYYSGFGPGWRRKRGGFTGEKKVMSDNENNFENNMSKKNNNGTEMVVDGFDYVEEEDNDHGKKKMNITTKRGSKPLKERSLKSFM